MIVDIREDIPDFLEYVRKRVEEHVAKAKKAKKPAPVKIIEFGFEFGQANWVALVFDTRKNAEPDGEWSSGIEKILLERPKWPIWRELPDNAKVHFINLAGKKINVMDDPDNLVCSIIGDALKHVLLTAKNRGMFKSLPRAEKCKLGVENLEGYYGWPIYEDRGKENLL